MTPTTIVVSHGGTARRAIDDRSRRRRGESRGEKKLSADACTAFDRHTSCYGLPWARLPTAAGQQPWAPGAFAQAIRNVSG
jgi:hypothetical protein